MLGQSLVPRGNVNSLRSKDLSYINRCVPSLQRACLHCGGRAFAAAGENSAGVQRYIEQAEGRLVNVAKLVSHTGGEVIEVNKEKPLAPAFGTIIQRLKARYTLGYTPIGHALQDGRYHSVGVLMAAERCKKCRVEAKRGYFRTAPPGRKK